MAEAQHREAEYRQTIRCFHLTRILSCDFSNTKLG